MTDWNFANVWELVAELFPAAPALRHGERQLTWTEFDRRANGVARSLLDLGLHRQDKVAHYLYNSNEYLESTFGILKAGLVPVNTNYRYNDEELVYLWDNADAAAVIFHGTFAERLDVLRHKLPGVRGWWWVDDGCGPCPDWATPYAQAAEPTDDRIAGPWGRSGNDLYLLYTGGTTGMPKGVMWRQDDLFSRINEGNLLKVPQEGGLAGVRKTLVGPGPVHLPACPLMHGTGAFTSMGQLVCAGNIVTLTSRRFDPVELLDTVDEANVNTVAIVGDAFAKPILRALEDQPRRWRLSTLVGIVSSGVMWSEETKRGLLKHHPTMVLLDAFSSSEAVGMGTSLSSSGATEHTARFTVGEDVAVLDPDTGREVTPGSGERGVLAIGGRNPLGYYKDTAKSAATFREFAGVRYSIPGDWATVDETGGVQLLGRGSVCINTGGEKVFPEEVEEAIKRDPAVRDAVVVGIADDRFGEVVAAVVELSPGALEDEARLIDQVRGHLAHFKAPRRIRFVDTLGRAPNGKADYIRWRDEMASWVAKEPTGSRATAATSADTLPGGTDPRA